MKISVLRQEYNGYGISYRAVATADYSVNHQWTSIEQQIIDKLVIDQDPVYIEWKRQDDDSNSDVLQLWSVSIGDVSFNFYQNNDLLQCSIKQVLPLSERVIERLAPIILLVKNKPLATSVKNKVRTEVTKVIKQIKEETFQKGGKR